MPGLPASLFSRVISGVSSGIDPASGSVVSLDLGMESSGKASQGEAKQGKPLTAPVSNEPGLF